MNIHTNSIGREDVPLGLEMKFAVNPDAMICFANMSVQQQNSVIHYVKNASTGEEAENKVLEAIQKLNENDMKFFS